MTKRPVEVHIEGLVLPAGTVGTRAIRAAIEREVARAMRRDGPTANAKVGAVDVEVGRATGARAIGAKVAKAAGSKLGKG